MNTNEIKKVLYKEKPIAELKGIFRDGGSRSYIAETSIGYIEFFVPIKEIRANEDLFKNKMEAQLLIRYLDIERTQKLNNFIEKHSSNDKQRIEVFKGEGNYGRGAYLSLDNDKVVFDCSDEEYGPIEFPLSLLVDKLKDHKVRTKCNCICHTTPGVLHFMACCNNGYIETSIKDFLDGKQKTI